MQLMSTKNCPNCGDERLILLRSLNLKYCTECNEYIYWTLTTNQAPLVTNNRVKNGSKWIYGDCVNG